MTIKELGNHLELTPEAASIVTELYVHGPTKGTHLMQQLNITALQWIEHASVLLNREWIHCNSIHATPEAMYNVVPMLLSNPTIPLHIKNVLLHCKKQPAQKLHFDTYTLQGWDGIREGYEEILQVSIREQDHMLALENNEINTYLSFDFIEEYISKRQEAEIKAYVICGNSEADQQYAYEHSGPLTEVNLKSKMSIDANLVFVGSTIFSYTTNPPMGIIRQFPAEAKTYRSVFWQLWGNESHSSCF